MPESAIAGYGCASRDLARGRTYPLSGFLGRMGPRSWSLLCFPVVSDTGLGLIGVTGHLRFIVALALGLFAWSLSASAQQPPKIPRIGILSDEGPSQASKTFELFAQGLQELGWADGRNVIST